MKKNKYIVTILSLAVALMLSACVSEEGARRHAAKGSEMPTGVIAGMEWEAKVYSTSGGDEKVLGHFQSRSECHGAVLAYMEAHAAGHQGDLASACAVTASN